MSTLCRNDARRGAVRRFPGRNGLDYIEVSDDQLTLYVYFLGKLPSELQQNRPGLEQYLRLEGGQRISGIRILDVDPKTNEDPEKDDYLVVRLDRAGDFSTYTLHLVNLENIDARYDRVAFSFKVNCPSDLDCAPTCACEPAVFPQPHINYLAKDYASFRQLILDRWSLLMPDWHERHVPDLGIVLAELLAYAGDYLSYYQDAVATEAYLATARQRVSVGRHVRLMDYRLHEGCNARAWVCVETSQDLKLEPAKVAFITGLNEALPLEQTVLSTDQLQTVPPETYEFFEPMLSGPDTEIHLVPAHNEIPFYTWGQRECCLARGATCATLLDQWTSTGGEAAPGRVLQLNSGDILIFEEVIGPRTGVAADADPRRRHAVRLTKVTPAEDPLFPVSSGPEEEGQRPTPVLEIEWSQEDALPFPLCLSCLSQAPECRYLPRVSVARGNVILVDHGRSLDPEDIRTVPAASTESCCECEGHPSDVQVLPGRFRPALAKTPVTFREPWPAGFVSASRSLHQDARRALPQVQLLDSSGAAWEPQLDLLASGPDDRHCVAEIDNDRVAQLRFGNGELGSEPDAGLRFTAWYRIGMGIAGNVGAEAISRLVLKDMVLSGISLQIRNPLPAQGGTEPEPIDEAKLSAPAAFRKRIERAITADDYARLAERNPSVQRAAANLVWTGSWSEADVAVDPLHEPAAEEDLLETIAQDLNRYRRIGHDLHLRRARYVPLDLRLEVCALPGHDRGQVKAALLDTFSNRVLPGGQVGFFHPDKLTFRDGIYLSRIVAAAQGVPGVECARVTRLQRLFETPNHEIERGLLALGPAEIAQLENDPNHPEHGKLQIIVRGGR